MIRTLVTLGMLVAATASAAPRRAKPASIISEAQLQQNLKKQRGQAVVLHFWASWCLPCLEELPLVAKLATEAKSRGYHLYSVSLDDPTPPAAAKVGQLLSDRGSPAMTSTILRIEDPDTFISHIDPRWEGTIPAFFAYDTEGKLRGAHVGEMTRAHFDKFVGDVLPARTKTTR